MKKYSGKKLAAVLLLMSLMLCAFPSLAELIHREGGPTGGVLYFDEDELTGRGEIVPYGVTGKLQTGKKITFTVAPSMNKQIESYGIYRKPDDGGKVYQCVYNSSSSTMTYTFYQTGTYRLYVIYADGDCDRTSAFQITGKDYASRKAKAVVAQCPEGDDYERALWLHDWLATNSYYDDTLAYHGADGVLCRGYGVCQSYAEAYRMLLSYAGISADLVISNAQNHEWNALRLNGRWYMADVTWDRIGHADAGQGSPADYCRHTYFAVPTSVLSSDHYGFTDRWSCTSVKDNYYMREGQAAQIADALAEPICAGLNLGLSSFSVDAEAAAEKQNIGENTPAGINAVKGDLAAELASVLLYGTTCENDAGDNFYLMTSHQAGSCDSNGNVKTKDTTVAVKTLPGSGRCAADVAWRYEDGTLTVSGTGIVPDYAVGASPWGAVLGARIRSVRVEEGVTSVNASFRDCVNAAEVTLPASAESVSSDAFAGCVSMKWANVVCGTAGLSWAKERGISFQASGTHQADSMAKCGVCGRAFSMNGSGILHLPASLTQLGRLSFAESGASALVIPKDCEALPQDTFLGCEHVKTLFIPAALEEKIPETLRGQLTDLVVMTY